LARYGPTGCRYWWQAWLPDQLKTSDALLLFSTEVVVSDPVAVPTARNIQRTMRTFIRCVGRVQHVAIVPLTHRIARVHALTGWDAVTQQTDGYSLTTMMAKCEYCGPSIILVKSSMGSVRIPLAYTAGL
jgi:hypothetical protein